MIRHLFSLTDKCFREGQGIRTNRSTLHLEHLESRYVLDGAVPLNLQDWQSAIFDNGVTGTLPFEFSRDSATINPDGSPVAVNQPRFGDEELLSDVGGWKTALGNLGQNTILFASGWDHDGVTPVAVLWSVTTRKLTFVRGYDFSVERVLQLPANSDLLFGAEKDFRYLPQTGIVHEGLIVLMLRRDRRSGGSWITEGVSFAYTQDLGETFQRVEQVGGGYDVPAIAGGVTDGMDRVRSWAFANAFPEKSADDVLGAWFPWADYIQKSSFPKGGQIGLFRARREAVGEPWVVEPNRTVFEDWHPDDSGGLHAHSAGMFVDGMVSFWGDVSYRNRMVRHVAEDLENYTTTTWTHEEQFHGGWSPSNSPVHDLGNQATSAAPGPVFGEVLVAGDEQVELMMKIQRPDSLGEKAIITNLHGSFPGTVSGAGFDGRISQSFQHLRGQGYVVTELSTLVPGTRGLFYSPDGIHWAELVDLGGNKYFYGNKIIAVSGNTLVSLDVPSNHSAKAPLLLNPGGQNLATSDPVKTANPAAGNTARRVLYVEGVYVYQDTLEPLDVQPPGPPPVMDGMPMWEFTATGTNKVMGAWELGDILSQSDKLHWLNAWHYSLDGDGIAPSFRVGDRVNTERQSVWVANSHWVPSQNFGVPNPASSELNEQRTRLMNGANPAPRRWLTAIEGYNEGEGPTYPLAPGTQGSDELASVLLNSTSSSWSTALTFGLSELSAFSTHFDPVGTGTVHTLASIYESDTEHVDITFTRTGEYLGTISVDVYGGGQLIEELDFANIYFDREDQMRMVISNSPNEFGVTLLATRGNYGVVSETSESLGAGFTPNEIRLSNADQTVVEPLEWYAIQFSPTQALSTAQREAMVGSSHMFERLDGPPLGQPSDFDGDGDVDGRDFLAWQRGYGTTGSATREDGDANGDGHVNGVDLGFWQDSYGTGTISAPQGADFDGNAIVDSSDLAVWQENYGTSGTQSEGDADNDGDVDGCDFLFWQRQCSEAQAGQIAVGAVENDESMLPITIDDSGTDAGQSQLSTESQGEIEVEASGFARIVGLTGGSNDSDSRVPSGFWLPVEPQASNEDSAETLSEPAIQELVLLKKHSLSSELAFSDRHVQDSLLLAAVVEGEAGSTDEWGLSADLAIEDWPAF